MMREFPFAGLKYVSILFVASCAVFAGSPACAQEAHDAHAANVKQNGSVFVVFLGTGMPRPNPQRQGPSLAIIVNHKAYLVDAGVGVVRQAAAASERGFPALRANQLDIAFLTHLHSDHTLGLPDLILTPWVMHRVEPLQLYGPMGTRQMVDAIEKAYAADIDVRIHGLEHQTTTGYQVVVHEIQSGFVYTDANVKVTAFAVHHGSWKEALGYRFDADGKSIVISGDTSPAESVVKACHGCDVLIHEVYTWSPTRPGSPTEPAPEYFRSFHTSARELGEIAAKAQPKLLVVTHYVPVGDRQETDALLLDRIHEKFHGPVLVANDLDVISP